MAYRIMNKDQRLDKCIGYEYKVNIFHHEYQF